MADTTIFCGHCGKNTEHMHLGGKTCICSICGESNEADNWREIQAEVEKRVKENLAEVARRSAVKPDPELLAVAKLPYTERGFREPSKKTKPKENTMKTTKMTDEKIAAIRADYAALTEDQRTPAARKELADKHDVSMPTFMKYTRLMERKTSAASRGRKDGRPDKSVKAQRQEGRAPAGSFKAAIQALVEAAAACAVKEAIKELGLVTQEQMQGIEKQVDARVEAALAEALK